MFKHSFKKLTLVLSAVLILALVLSACGSKSAKTQQSVGTKTSQDQTKPDERSAEQQTAESKKPVSLKIWLPGNGPKDVETYKTLVENLKKEKPHVTGEVTQVPWGEYFTKLNVAFSGGAAPDVYGVGYGQIGPVQAAGNMLALDDYLKDWDGWQDIPANILDVARKDGKLYGLALPEVRVLYYRTDLFKEAGLTQPPKTVDEIYDYAKKLSKVENGKIKMSGLEIGTGEQSLFSVMLMHGANRLWDEKLQSAMTDEKAIKAFEWCNRIMQEKLSDHTIMHDIQGSLFENGIAAMNMGGSSAVPIYNSKLGPDKWDVALLPGDNYMMGTTCMAVYSKTKYPEEAVAMWKTITSKEGMLLIAKNIGFVPTRKSIEKDYINLDPKHNKVFFDAAQKAVGYGPMNQYFFEFVNNIRPIIDEVYYGKKQAKPAMEEFEKKYNDAVKKAQEGKK